MPRPSIHAFLLGPILLASPALAAPIPITNPGFEDLNITLRPGEQTNGAGGSPTGPIIPVTTRWQFPFQQGDLEPQPGALVPGWRTINPTGPGSLAGVLNPNVTFNWGGVDTPWMTGYSGNHVGVAQAAFMQQTLTTQVQANTTYTLSFLAGIGITDSQYTPLIQLLAAPDLTTFATPGTPGVETLGRYEGPPIDRPEFGVVRPCTITYTSPAILPPSLQGKYLAIAFLGSDGIPRVNYDDFALDATPVPGVAAFAIIVTSLVPRRRRRQ